MNSEPTNTVTDEQLKLYLAKMIPKLIEIYGNDQVQYAVWKKGKSEVKDTEWLYACWLVERGLDYEDFQLYRLHLGGIVKRNQEVPYITPANHIHASWRQRAIALCRMKGISDSLTNHSVGVEI